MEEMQTFRGPALGWRDGLFLILPGLAGVLAPLIVGVYRASEAYARYGLVTAQARSRPFFLTALVALLLFLLAVLIRLRRAHQRIVLQREGLTVQHGLRKRVLPWEAIHAVHLRPRGQRLHAILHLYDGRRVRLPALPNLPAAVIALQRRRAEIVLPPLQRRLKQGELLPFGRLTLSRHGLHLDGKAQPWKALRQANIANGHLVIEFLHSVTWQIPIADVTDLHLLLIWLERRGMSNL